MGRGSFNTQGDSSPTVPLIQGTPEQEKIWDTLLHTDKHVIVEAVAGSGKTFVIVEYAKRERHARVGLVAFNKHIALELTQRTQGQSNVEAMTYHSLGYRTCKKAFGYLGKPDEYRVFKILDAMHIPVENKYEKVTKYRIKAVVGMAKQYGLGAGSTEDEFERLVDHHDIDLSDFPGLANVVYDYAPKVLAKCRDVRKGESIDFDDMVWLPMELGLRVPEYDVLCVDEYQDTGLTQQWLAVRGGKRLCAVGDPKQAIYAFRGADSRGFDRLRDKLGSNVVTLPLTLTRRCPQSHVRLAQMLVPQIRALDHAPEGIVRIAPDLDRAVADMAAGDLVVCRVNAELIGTAYKLLKRGVKAVVRGRDIGKGMLKLIEEGVRRSGTTDATGAVPLAEVIKHAGDITTEAVQKLLAIPYGRGELRAANAGDRYDCVCELAQGCKTVVELNAIIERLFEDFEADGSPKNAVVLGTVHRTKGLEGNRVFILRPDLMPHPMAKKPHDKESEKNLAYVAVTRAKFEGEFQGELVFVGCMSPLFEGGEGHADMLRDHAAAVHQSDDLMQFLKDGHGAKHEHALYNPDEAADGDEGGDDEEPEWVL